jgi:ribokinase
MVGLEDSQRGHHEFAAADLLVIQLEIPLPAVDAAIKKSSALGVDILLNPAPACAIPPDTLAMVKYLVLNETEAGTLTGMEVQGLSSAASAAQELLGMGVGVVVITLGANGAYTAIRDGAFHEPAYIIDPVDTTAAGDAFIGGFTVAISEGQGLQKAVRMGNAAGALAAQKFGAQTSLPNRDDLEAFLKSRA